MCCIRLQSRSKKITFVVRVMLYFVRKYPGTKVTLPVKTVRTIYLNFPAKLTLKAYEG